MKVAVFSESPVDEAALRILIDALIGSATESVDFPWLKGRGWPSILQYLPKVMQYVYYQTDADGLVVVVDSDNSLLHGHTAQQTADFEEKCRLCRLQKAIAPVRESLALIPGRPALNVAMGLAVPAIEAWYRCGLDPHVNEATWIHALQSGQGPYDRRGLKRAVYGTERPSLELATRIATEQARRLVEEQKLELLENLFPQGFGTLANDVRNW